MREAEDEMICCCWRISHTHQHCRSAGKAELLLFSILTFSRLFESSSFPPQHHLHRWQPRLRAERGWADVAAWLRARIPRAALDCVHTQCLHNQSRVPYNKQCDLQAHKKRDVLLGNNSCMCESKFSFTRTNDTHTDDKTAARMLQTNMIAEKQRASDGTK